MTDCVILYMLKTPILTDFLLLLLDSLSAGFFIVVYMLLCSKFGDLFFECELPIVLPPSQFVGFLVYKWLKMNVVCGGITPVIPKRCFP